MRFQNQEFDSKEFLDETGLEMYEFKYRMDDPQIGRFWQIDPLSEDYFYNSIYAFSENKVVAHVELEGLETFWIVGSSSILVGNASTIASSSSVEANAIPKPVIETMLETNQKAGPTRFSPETLKNFSRGRTIEAEKLAENGIEKNTQPIEAIDPKTGKPGTTIPDGLKNDGKSTAEIKNVKSQSFTRQLRLQEKYSNENGFKPELIINKGAKISGPLKNSSFDIKPYSVFPGVDNTRPTPISKITAPERTHVEAKKVRVHLLAGSNGYD